MKEIIVSAIKFYQYLSRNLLRYNPTPLVFYSSCKFYPTCSEYAVESIGRHGVRKGVINSIKRIIKCHPWAIVRVDNP